MAQRSLAVPEALLTPLLLAHADLPTSLREASVVKRDIHDAIDEWHKRPEDGVSLHAYLGMTWEEYKLWAESGILPDDSPFHDSDHDEAA